MNLDKSSKYKIIATSHGSIEDSMGFCCENCGRLICNIATLENEKKERFFVGMDCAKTLSQSGNVDFFELQWAEAGFDEGKAFRAKIQKFNKKYPDGNHYVYTSQNDGTKFLCNSQRGMSRIYHPHITLEFIKDLIKE